MALQSKSIMCLRLVDRLIDRAFLSSQASPSSPNIGDTGWIGYICDTGSRNYGKLITVRQSYPGVDTANREVRNNADNTTETTYLRLLREKFIEGEAVSWKKRDEITVYDPGSIYHGRNGTLTEDGKVNQAIYVKLDGDGFMYWGLTKNFIMR